MANNQTIGVNLKFSADVSAAKKAMAELQDSLAQIHNAVVTSSNPGIRYAKDLNQASQAAAQLRIQLQNAFNQDTGKLNLTKFNMEMKQAGMSVEKYRAALTSIGPQGQQAFTQLAHSVAIAETNTINLSAGIQRLGTTFMNTLRYQLSSAVIMGFTQSIGEAVTYVKDLNASLNDIRIVTNYGVDEMKEFANYANKAAKALSTTTNEYAKASLIYFQQGLTDEEVQKRTDLTIKMANVTGQAVGEVSDQLTSVWNNFDNGTKSLEHYVDVMVALGAATASSSEEISEGLNKFAAVAETVGLSYEYAAAALATVTATTRQSADIVGTAFKTLFARIQDLKLGKELDDGTTLGQYSQALAAVGINIKDVNGEVKDMNSILDEMGAKWNTLSKDSQIALAQNVAGIRQYTQLIALMDNWNFFKQNLETTNASTGALQEQADIYAESWEAASERVTASLETIYDKLLNDEFFIDAINLLADFIGLVENLIDGLGGMPGVLALVGVALTKVFSTQMAQGINNMTYNIRSMTKAGKAENARLQQEFANAAAEQYGTHGASGQQGVLAKEEAKLQEITIRNKGKMTELEQQQLDTRINELRIQKQQIDGEIEQTKILEQQASLHKRISQTRMSSKSLLGRQEGFSRQEIDNADINNNYAGSQVVQGTRGSFLQMNQQEQERAYSALYSSSAALQINAGFDIGDEDTFSALRFNSPQNSQQYSKAIEELQSRLKSLGITAEGVDAQMQDIIGPELSSEYQSLAKAVEQAQKEIYEYAAQVSAGKITEQEFRDKVSQSTKAVRDAEHQLQLKTSSMQKDSQEAIRLAGGTNQATEAIIENGTAAGENQRKIMNLGQLYDLAGKSAEKSAIRILDFGTAMQQSATMISTLTMVVTSLVGLFKTLSDPEIDPSEKITTVLTTVGFMLPTIIGLFNEQNKSLFLTAGAALSAAGGHAVLKTEIEATGFAALKTNYVLKGLGKTLGKFAIYAAAIAIVIGAVVALAKVADNARNSTEKFAASATQNAKNIAEAYSQATTAFNELKNSIENYENAVTGLQKLTQGTNEYKQALFDANEQALALMHNHTGLKYYIDANGLIVFEEGELNRIESEAQQKKADIYSAKISADIAAGQASLENQKVQLGRQLKGRDILEWNSEDTASTATGASIGAGIGGAAGVLGGAALFKLIGGTIGTALGGPLGTAIGAAAGVALGGLLGAYTGAGASLYDNDATNQEKKTLDGIYELYKQKGNAIFDEKDFEKVLREELKLDDEALIQSLIDNTEAIKKLTEETENQENINRAQWMSAWLASNPDVANKNNSTAMASIAFNQQNAARDTTVDSMNNKEIAKAYLIEVLGEKESDIVEADGKWIGKHYAVGQTGGKGFTLYTIDSNTQELKMSGAENQQSIELATESVRNARTVKNISEFDVAEEYARQREQLESLGDNEELINRLITAKAEGKNLNLRPEEYYTLKGKEVGTDFKEIVNNSLANTPEYIKDSVFKGWYEGLNKADQELVWEIELDKDATFDQFKTVFEKMQIYAKNNEISLNVKATSEFAEWSDFTETGLDGFFKSVIDAGIATKDEIDEKTGQLTEEAKLKYLAMSKEERQQIANSRKNAIQTKSGVVVTLTQEQAQKDYEEAQNEQKNLDNEAKVAEQEYNDLKEQRQAKIDKINNENAMLADIASGQSIYTALVNLGREDLAVNIERIGFQPETEEDSELLRKYFSIYGQDFKEFLEADNATKVSILGQMGPGFSRKINYQAFDDSLPTEQDIIDAEKDWEKAREKADNYNEDTNAEQARRNAALSEQAWKEEFAAQNERYNLEVETIEAQVDNLTELAKKNQDVNKELLTNEFRLKKVAQASVRVNKGLDDLTANWIQWGNVIHNSNKTGQEYAETMDSVRMTLADTLNTNKDFISNDFIDEHFNKIAAAAYGDVDAINALRAELAKQIIAGGIDYSQLSKDIVSLDETIREYSTANPLTIGTVLTGTDKFVEDCQKLIELSEMTEEAATAYLNSIGYTAEIIDGKIQSLTYIGDVSKIYDLANQKTATPKKLEDELDRYHKIKEELQDIERELNAISKAKQRAFGQSKLDLIQKEIDKQNELLDAEKRYQVEAGAYLQEDQKAINSYGFATDETGRITNYKEVMEQAVNAYNTGTMSPEHYERMKKAVANYEESLDLVKDKQQAVIDKKDEIFDLNLEKVEYTLELKIKVHDNELKELEYQLEKLDDPIEDAVNAIIKLGEIAQKNIDKVKEYHEAINNVFVGYSENEIKDILAGNLNVELTEGQISVLENYRDALYESNASMEEFKTGIQEKVIDALENSTNEFDKNDKVLNRFNSTLETYQDIIDLVGIKTLDISTAMIKELGRAQVENSKATLANLEAERAVAEANLKSLQETRDASAQDSEDYKYWDEMVKAAEEKLIDLEDSVSQTWTNSLQIIADEFANAVEIAIKEFEESINGMSFDKMQEDFNQRKEKSERFVADYQKIYQLNKLNRDITKSIDETDSIVAKQELLDLQKEINSLQEDDTQMSEYDLEYLRKKYDLRVAEIALEEAQNAKSEVRMQRDSEGNWGYVYTANEEKTAEAQQNYEDKLYAVQEHAQNYIDEMQDAAIQSQIDMVAALQGLRKEDFDNEAEYQAEIEKITKYYTEQRQYYLAEMNKSIENSSKIYENDWTEYSKNSGYKLSEDKKWRDSFAETQFAMTTGYTTLEDAGSDFESNTQMLVGKLTGAFQTWQADVKEACAAAGKSLNGDEEGSFKKGLEDAVKDSNEESKKIVDNLDDISEEAKKAFEGIVDKAEENYKEYSKTIDNYIGKNDALILSINNLIAKRAELKATETSSSTESETNYSSNPTGTPEGTFKGNETSSYISGADIEQSIILDTFGTGQAAHERNYTTSHIVLSGADFDKISKTSISRTNDFAVFKYQGDNYIIHTDEMMRLKEILGENSFTDILSTKQNRNFLNKGYDTSFDTGGYTGSWGPEGRVAMLHQKEIVLNADDTSNFLSAIQIIRDISHVIDLRAAAQQSALSQITAASVSPMTQTLEQEVTIHAEFPNATQRTEIEAAFDTLLNRASQFANRKNK